MTVQNVKSVNAEHLQLLGTVKNLIAPKKINIMVFDANGDKKLSTKELKVALKQIPNMKVQGPFVNLNDYDMNGNLVKTISKLTSGDPYSVSEYKYNKKGQKIEEKLKNASGETSTKVFGYYPDGKIQTVKSTTANNGIIFNYSPEGELLNIQPIKVAPKKK